MLTEWFPHALFVSANFLAVGGLGWPHYLFAFAFTKSIYLHDLYFILSTGTWKGKQSLIRVEKYLLNWWSCWFVSFKDVKIFRLWERFSLFLHPKGCYTNRQFEKLYLLLTGLSAKIKKLKSLPVLIHTKEFRHIPLSGLLLCNLS